MSAATTLIKAGVLQGDLNCNNFKLLNVDLTDIISEEFGLQTANRMFAGPGSGSPANPTFRAMVDADLPDNAMLVTENLAGLSSNATARTNLGLTTTATAANTPTGLQLLAMDAPALEGTEFMISDDGQPDWVTGATVLSLIGAEAALGNPASNGYVLSSTTGGVRSWVSQTAAVLPAVDTTSLVKGSVDASKQLRIEVDGFSSSTIRVLTAPNKNGTIACLDDVPYIAGILFGADQAGRGLTLAGGDVAFYGEWTLNAFGFAASLNANSNASFDLPEVGGTLVTLDGTQDLTNKSYNGISLGGTGGIQLSDGIVSITGTFLTEGTYHLLSGGFSTDLTTTGDTSLTLPESGTLATRENAETLANKMLEAVVGIGIKNVTSGFDLNMANSDGVASADRTLSINLNNVNRAVSLAGNLTLAGSLTTVGAFGTTLTATATTALTLPTDGTVASFVSGKMEISGTSATISAGTGAPEGSITANVGSLFMRTNTGELYIKNSGSGNTGWLQVQTV